MSQQYMRLCSDLQMVLRTKFPNCTLYPFGSTLTGLDFPNSDVDLYVNVGGSSSSRQTASAYVNESRQLFYRFTGLFSNVCAIPNAKTPIIKCVHIPTNISCDFNFKNILGVCNTYLVQYLLSIDRRMITIMKLIKFWAKMCALSGQGRFSNYSLCILFVFYLQQMFDFPSVVSLQAGKVDIQDGWNVYFEKRPLPLTKAQEHDIPEILHGFFDYYSNFDYSLVVISPYLGRTLLRTDFVDLAKLPDEFHLYKDNIKNVQHLRIDSFVCVQDPFEHNHNIAAAVPLKVLEEFIAGCRLGASLFNDRLKLNDALYLLFKEEIEIMDNHGLNFDNECQLKFSMTPKQVLYVKSLLELSSNDTNTDGMETQIRTKWYLLITEFISKFLIHVLRMRTQVRQTDRDNKAQKLSDQIDVHDSKVIDAVVFHCSGKYNMWDCRKSIGKDILAHKSDVTSWIDKQTFLSNYIIDVLYKNVELKDDIVEFELTMQTRILPTEVNLHLKSIYSHKGSFRQLAAFFVKYLPAWIDKDMICNVKSSPTEELNDKQ